MVNASRALVMPLYFASVALLVFFCCHVESKGSKGKYTQVTTTNCRDLCHDGILEFANGTDDISIELTTANKGKTMELAIRLTEEAHGVLSFDVNYGVQSQDCLNKTTAKFHFGEQFGRWTSDSNYFKVMMMQGTVDPVVPFEFGKDLQITVDPNSTVLTVTSGGAHNWVKDAIIKSEALNATTTLYTPMFSLDVWDENGKCALTDQEFVKIKLHNAEVTTKAAGIPPPQSDAIVTFFEG
ncbi:hypothetical protein AAVH_08144 [Aphelenchoides avenae]|nr:hypothetical protein AAVH_08144 [Aphelenchus avenae]